jgi:hypothetical protein
MRMQLFDVDRHGVFFPGRLRVISRGFAKKATLDVPDVNRSCPASYAGLTRVSIILHKNLFETDGLPGQARQ